MKNIMIVVLVVGLGFVSYRLAEVENQRYALVTGACEIDTSLPTWVACLEDVETRTSFWWNLYYGLTG